MAMSIGQPSKVAAAVQATMNPPTTAPWELTKRIISLVLRDSDSDPKKCATAGYTNTFTTFNHNPLETNPTVHPSEVSKSTYCCLGAHIVPKSLNSRGDV